MDITRNCTASNILTGTNVLWTVTLSNQGNVPLTNVAYTQVDDGDIVAGTETASCSLPATLNQDEECTVTFVITTITGRNEVNVSATANGPCGEPASAADSERYNGNVSGVCLIVCASACGDIYPERGDSVPFWASNLVQIPCASSCLPRFFHDQEMAWVCAW